MNKSFTMNKWPTQNIYAFWNEMNNKNTSGKRQTATNNQVIEKDIWAIIQRLASRTLYFVIITNLGSLLLAKNHNYHRTWYMIQMMRDTNLRKESWFILNKSKEWFVNIIITSLNMIFWVGIFITVSQWLWLC